jgi:CBS domain-containing protein
MLSEPIRNVMERKRLVMAAPDTNVSAAAQLMAANGVGAVMVVDGMRLVGIFTERDAVFRVVAQERDPRTTRLAEVMTPAPLTVAPQESFGYALILMHENGFRHVPVVENGKPVGMVSARNALDPELEEFESEARRRERIRRGATAP